MHFETGRWQKAQTGMADGRNGTRLMGKETQVMGNEEHVVGKVTGTLLTPTGPWTTALGQKVPLIGHSCSNRMVRVPCRHLIWLK